MEKRSVEFDEEIVGLSNYEYTLIVLSSEELPEDPEEDVDEDAQIWIPRLAYGRSTEH